ncbi:MAG TPA: LCP family protein [Anaerolineales bacterium]|nr:LCP family protein [Anaerolineales bacterium]
MPPFGSHSSFLRQLIFWAVALCLAAGAFVFARDLAACWRLTALPGLPPDRCAGEVENALDAPVIVNPKDTPAPTATPEPQPPEKADFPTWDGAGRINILFIGLRGGDVTEGDCSFCTDTLILLTVDPTTQTAGMISIPRDMWVNIPGFGYSRINTAWTLGRRSKLPGGGPDLTMKTVSHFIGVPVDYYVQVDFDTFVEVIDLIGGVDVYNDETLFLDPIANGREYPKVKLTCCGIRHLNGRVALAYARCRHLEQGCTDGDIGRARRQQKVIFGIREKVFDPENFADLLVQAPRLYSTFSGGIRTNMTLDEAIRLAVLVREIPRESIENRVIDHSMVSFGSATLGGQRASVLKPLPDKIRILRDEIFTPAGPVSPLAHGPALSLMKADAARVRVLNGSSTPQLESKTKDYLLQRGVSVTQVGETRASSRTTIVLYSPKLYAFRYLLDLFEITRSVQILIQPDPSETVDIEIRLGDDWVGRLPEDVVIPPESQ